jgi:hypothetical protein
VTRLAAVPVSARRERRMPPVLVLLAQQACAVERQPGVNPADRGFGSSGREKMSGLVAMRKNPSRRIRGRPGGSSPLMARSQQARTGPW